jgi:hypothetical protein
MPRCRHLIVRPDKDGKERLRANNTYQCGVEVPEPVFPASITKSHAYRWPPSRTWVDATDCAKCPLFNQL